KSNTLMLSTHVDVLAKASGQQDKVDLVSQVDFILHGVVTFPYTTYTDLKQINPASIHTCLSNSYMLQSKSYWVPAENYKYKTLEQAAIDLRKGLKNYVNAITQN